MRGAVSSTTQEVTVRGLLLPIAAVVALLTAAPASAHPQQHPRHCSEVRKVWSPKRWRRGQPKHRTIKAFRGCPNWAPAKRRYYAFRAELHRRDINRTFAPHWAPDYGGRTLPFDVVAALAEAAGMPGVTMAQVAEGESGLRPGSAGVDAGGTVGYGLLAITSPFADLIVAKYGGYGQMLNPVKNVAAAAEIYRTQGISAWYGTRYVTSTDAHYRGKLDLSKVLGGLSFRRALAG